MSFLFFFFFIVRTYFLPGWIYSEHISPYLEENHHYGKSGNGRVLSWVRNTFLPLVKRMIFKFESNSSGRTQSSRYSPRPCWQWLPATLLAHPTAHPSVRIDKHEKHTDAQAQLTPWLHQLISSSKRSLRRSYLAFFEVIITIYIAKLIIEYGAWKLWVLSEFLNYWQSASYETALYLVIHWFCETRSHSLAQAALELSMWLELVPHSQQSSGSLAGHGILLPWAVQFSPLRLPSPSTVLRSHPSPVGLTWTTA